MIALPLPLATGTGTAAGVLYAFEQSDAFAKIIILLLFAFSIQAWTIMIEKGASLRRVRRKDQIFTREFRECRGPFDMMLGNRAAAGPIMNIYQSGVAEIVELLDLPERETMRFAHEHRLPRQLSPYEVDRVRSAMERAVSGEIDGLERRLPLLGTTVTISPFLGLLGTVWGVMMAFVGMARAGRPDIGAMAPGVSGALLTTVVGLVVAIPSVVGFNLLTSATRQTITSMDNFVDDFVSMLRLHGGELEPTGSREDEEPQRAARKLKIDTNF